MAVLRLFTLCSNVGRFGWGPSFIISCDSHRGVGYIGMHGR